MQYWEDRVSKEQGDAINKALGEEKRGRISKDELYDELTNNGLTSEEADAFCQLED